MPELRGLRGLPGQGTAGVRGGGALINRNLGASGALEIAHTPRVPAVIRVEMGRGDCALSCSIAI